MAQSNKQSAPVSTTGIRQQSTSTDLPNVQSKEIILTEFDNQTFAKRKVENNWSKYDELSEDDDNEQMMAANFEQMLLGPKSIGGHFAFSSEKHWDNLDADGQMSQAHGGHEQLFKLDLNSLKSGISGVPFDVRLGYVETMFDANEMADITNRAGWYDRFVRGSDKSDKTQRDLTAEFKQIEAILKAAGTTTSQPQAIATLSAKNPAPPPVKLLPTVSMQAPVPAQVAIPAQSIENIQGWLDDILNSG